MFESFSESLGLFGIYTIMGLVFGFVYYLGSFIRTGFGLNKVVERIGDCLFILICGLIVFLYSVTIGTGTIRLYYLFALALGFSIYSVTLGRLTVLLANGFRRVVLRVRGVVFSAFLKITKPILLKIRVLFVDIQQKLSKFKEKRKIYLKNDTDLVYNVNINKMGKIVGEGGENRNVIKAKVSKNS